MYTKSGGFCRCLRKPPCCISLVLPVQYLGALWIRGEGGSLCRCSNMLALSSDVAVDTIPQTGVRRVLLPCLCYLSDGFLLPLSQQPPHFHVVCPTNP